MDPFLKTVKARFSDHQHHKSKKKKLYVDFFLLMYIYNTTNLNHLCIKLQNH